MKKTEPEIIVDPKMKHGTTKAYIIGFALSLIFTLIPYQLVVNKTFTGHGLLGVILAFAFLQLVVQLVYFLHLGRERGPRWQTGFLAATFCAVLTVIGGSLWIISHLHNNMLSPADMQRGIIDDEAIPQVGGVKTGSCEGLHTNHRVMIMHGVASPSHTDAQLCDTLTFTNEDDKTRDMAFGPHLNHGAYAGKTGKTLYKNRSWTITLSQLGTYQFHDHRQEEMAGDFTVAPVSRLGY